MKPVYLSILHTSMEDILVIDGDVAVFMKEEEGRLQTFVRRGKIMNTEDKKAVSYDWSERIWRIFL